MSEQVGQVICAFAIDVLPFPGVHDVVNLSLTSWRPPFLASGEEKHPFGEFRYLVADVLWTIGVSPLLIRICNRRLTFVYFMNTELITDVAGVGVTR